MEKIDIKPSVSICMPVFNASKYLEATLNSVVNQSYRNLEIIIVDDGSTDTSLEIARRFNDVRIKIFEQENLGAASARNLAIKHSSGDYIQFLDADDIISVNKIADQVTALDGKPYAIAVCKTIFFYDDDNPYHFEGQKGQDLFLYNSDNPIDFLMNLWGENTENKMGMIQTNAWLTPKTLIDKTGYWSEFYSPDDDGEYFCKVLSNAKEVCYTPACYNYYRKFVKSKSLSSRNSHKALYGIYKSIVNKHSALENKVKSNVLQKVIQRQLFDVLYHAYGIYPDIVKLIKANYPDLINSHHKEPIGGTVINTVKNVFGWKFAKRVQNLNQKFKVSIK